MPILGNQLFPWVRLKPHADAHFFLAEDLELCTYVRHHKQKLVLFLAAMRSYADELRDHDADVHYVPLSPACTCGAQAATTYEAKLTAHLHRLREQHGSDAVSHVRLWEVEDKWFEQRLEAWAGEHDLDIQWLTSPMFVTTRQQFEDYLDEASGPFMAKFYERQRRRLKIMVDDAGAPHGGQWSYDHDNREKLPDHVEIPDVNYANPTQHVQDVMKLVGEHFRGHPGQLDDWWLPTTRRQALSWLRQFLDDRFYHFGPYEDALSNRGPWLFHSVLSPMMNMGLITPDEVLDRAVAVADEKQVPINSLEGFVRQIIGWREFIRGIYREYSEKQEQANHFGATGKLTDHWYDATTGIPPLDDAIRKAQRFGWTHHIERLMVLGNLMNLTGLHPHEAHRWFMEMYVDSSDWVMGPNVYGMALHSDGGIFATKPYIAGSNYLRKMSAYKCPRKPTAASLHDGEPVDGTGEATWCDVVDGLYWRFIDQHRATFVSNPRMSMMTRTLDKLKPDRRKQIFGAAERFIERVVN
jgi:deoxyribodipyrimidine photolyase-related protein